jgi:23S rRNA pseudouridine2457 synthase
MQHHQHFLLHKPYGYLSQFISNQKYKRKKKMLGELYDFPQGTMAIGRLDEKSEGLLLLTTDGKTSDFITTRGNVEKEYYAQVDGIISEQEIIQLKNGVEISIEGKKYITKPCIAKLIDTPNYPERTQKIRDDRHGPTSWVSITLTEGKFRQVRKMTAVVGFPTLRLIRVRIGSVLLDNLSLGEVRKVDSLM